MYLLDKSAFEAVNRDELAKRELLSIATAGPIAICAMVAMEILFSSRNPADHRDRRRYLDNEFAWLDTGEEVLKEALGLQELLHQRGKHRKPLPDIIIAALAKHYGVTVLHYDSDFDDISAVDDRVRSRWIIPRQRSR